MKISNLSVSGDYGKNGRLNMEEYFGLMTLIISQRSTCLRRHVGALIVDNGHVIATGYNGAPTKMDDCLKKGCLVRNGHCIRSVHAEQNALLQTPNLSSLKNPEIYVTDYPCQICAKSIIQAGIKKIHFVREYDNADDFVEEIFKKSGIKVDMIDLSKFLDNGDDENHE